MHLIPRESNRSVVSLQVCAELTRSGAHSISPQLMVRSINEIIITIIIIIIIIIITNIYTGYPLSARALL